MWDIFEMVDSAGICQSHSLDDDLGWADRCGYWLNIPVEKPRRGPPRMRLRIDNGALLVRNGFSAWPCGTPIDHAARHRGDRINAGYVGLWHLTSFAAVQKNR
jgi:hypothetical protein